MTDRAITLWFVAVFLTAWFAVVSLIERIVL